jgi:osmoprotectant transport system substrate-binding protein
MKKLIKVFLTSVLLWVFLIANTSGGAKGPIVVASKIDTEGALLGQMIVALLRNNGFEVIDKTEFGPTPLVRKSIINGQIDIYPEYTGNGGFFFSISSSDIWKNAKSGYEKVKALDLKKNNLVWLQPAPANNTWAMAIRGDLARSENIRTLEDFARYVNSGGDVKVAGSEEFVNRPDALPAFQKAYGFKLKKGQMLILSGGNTAQTEKAAAQRINGVNVAMAYGTDGALAALGLHVMEDTKGVQPVYEPAPIIRKVIFDRYPEIATILAPVFKTLTLTVLQDLNAKIALEGVEAREVAESYLKEHHFL